MSKTIGVAIATYNGANYLKQQLDSIAAQTLLPDFISVSDDCSTDATVEILQAFKENCSIPMVINSNSKQVGVLANFNLAFSQCNTDFIAYCDQDDVWEASKLETCLAYLDKPNVALVFHRSEIVDSNLKSMGRYEPFNIKEGRYTFPHYSNFLWGYGHQMVFKKEVLKVVTSIQRSDFMELARISSSFDRALLLAAGMVGDIFYIENDLIKFRRHVQSATVAGKASAPNYTKANFDDRYKEVKDQLKLIEAILAHVSNVDFSKTIQSSLEYKMHISRLRDVYEKRNVIYGSTHYFNRLCAFGCLLAYRAYGSVLKNKIPKKHMILDFLRCLNFSN